MLDGRFVFIDSNDDINYVRVWIVKGWVECRWVDWVLFC